MAKTRKTSAADAPSPFTLEGAKFYRPIIEAAVKDALAQYGVRVVHCKMHYGDTAKATIELAGSGSLDTSDAAAYKKFAGLLDMPADALGKTFVSEGKTYKIVGLNPRKKRKPVVMTLIGDAHADRRWYGTVESVLLRLNAAKAATGLAKKFKEDGKKTKAPKVKTPPAKTSARTGKRLSPKAKAKAGRRISSF
jgi:hypothetical protein